MSTTESKRLYRYTVYDNKTDFPVAVDKTSEECAEQMGITLSSFYCCVDRCGKGTNKRWTILKHDKCEQLCMGELGEIDKLPSLLRVSRLAKFLSTTDYYVAQLCKRLGVPIVKSGAQKIRMISRDIFFEKLERNR